MRAVTGTWDLALKTPIGTITATYTFEEDSHSLRGEARSTQETVPLVDIEVDVAEDGSELVRWHQRVTKPMRLNLDFEVTVTGDTMTGFSRAGRLPRTRVTGQRVAP